MIRIVDDVNQQAMEAARYIVKELIEHINSITNRKVKV
jgi:hypothetical protein